jgi:serine/threonine protein kinase
LLFLDRLLQDLGGGLFLGHYSPLQTQIFVRIIPWKGVFFNTSACCVRPYNYNLVFCEEAFFDGEDLVLLYEHCGKTTLKCLMEANYDFNEKTILCILYQILHGLELLHSQDLFHGNLMCSSIHIDECGIVKLSFNF